jgi:hypothetical protein
VRHRLDDDDVAGSGRRRSLDGVHADAPDAHDDDGLAGADVGHRGRRAPAGGDAAAHQGRDLQRDVGLDADDRGLVDRDVGGERAEQAHGRDALALGGDAVGAVGDRRPAEQEGAEVAEVLHALRTRRALAAGGDERGDDVVALLEVGHPGADLGDHARPLVAAEHRVLDRGAAGDEVLVGVAQARGRQLDGHLTGRRIADLDLLDRPFLAYAPQDRALGLHELPSVASPSLARQSGAVRVGTVPWVTLC